MAYNTLKGKVNFSNSTTGSIESMVDDYSAQTIGGIKTFSSIVSASAFYDTTAGIALGASALTAISSDGARRVLVSDGDGTATAYSSLVYNGTTLTASVFSGSAAALKNIPLGAYKVVGQLSSSNIFFGDGLQDSSNKLAAKGGNSITVGASGIAVDLAATGGLAHDAGKLKVSPNDATTKGSVSDNDIFLIADADASNATKKATATVLGTYMQNTLTFATPGGSDGQIQYKNGTAFAASSNLIFDTNTLTTVNVSASGHVSSSLFVGNGSGLTNVPAGSPAGINTNVQFNSGSTFSGSNNLNFNYLAGTNVLQVVGDLSASNDFAIGRDSLFGRDTTIMRNIVTYGNVSASINISASNFYGNGHTLSNVPIGNYTANRLVFCGAATNTLDAFNGLTWANPTLNVPGNVSATLGITGSALHTANTVIDTTHISSSLNISGSRFYGDGSNLTNLPSGGGISWDGSTANGVATYKDGDEATVESNLTFDGTNLRVVGTISASSTLHANGAATFGSTLKTTGSIVSHGGMRVSGSSYTYTLRDDSGNDMFKAEISSNHGRVRVRDQGNTVRVQLDGSGGVVSGSGTATFGAVSMDGTLAATTVTASGDVYGQTATFATVHLSGSETEALRIAKGASDTREIVFENDGADVASIYMNSAETLIIKNESNNDDIQFQTKPGGVATTAFTIDGATANVGVGTISPVASLEVSGSDTVELLHVGADSKASILVVSGSGKVGIGTGEPLTALDVRWDPGLLANDTGGGDVFLGGTGTLTAGKLYYLHTDGAWTETDADAAATGADQMIGIALGSNPTADGLLMRGFFDATTYVSNFSSGKAIYVSTTAASMDTTAPSGTGDFVRIVGYCTNVANVIYFNPSSEWIELD
jgi:hypothetical protein